MHAVHTPFAMDGHGGHECELKYAYQIASVNEKLYTKGILMDFVQCAWRASKQSKMAAAVGQLRIFDRALCNYSSLVRGVQVC